MKKAFFLFASLMCLGGSVVSAADFEVDGIYYDRIGNSLDVSVAAPPSGKHYSGAINIESSIEYQSRTYSVKQIGKNAFAEPLESVYSGDRLTSIEIANSVTLIDDGAFQNCIKLTGIEIPNRVTSIGISAFEGCTSLSNVTLSSYLEEIKNRAFANCTKLANLDVSSRITTIGDQAFFNCRSLNAIELPSKIRSIGNGAFQDCSKLTSVALGNSVAELGQSAFEGCSSLVSVELSSALKEIKIATFKQCVKLATIDLPVSVQTIAANAFDGCSALNNIVITGSVTEIGNAAFANCSGMKNVTFADSEAPLKYDDGNFSESLLESVTLGRTLNCVSTNGAFRGQSGLKTVKITSTCSKLPESIFRDCKVLVNVTVATGLTEIGQRAFQSCETLTSLKLPETVETIRSNAFNSCFKLSDFTMPPRVNVVETNSFYKCRNLRTIDLSNIIEIKNSAFYSCDVLDKVVFSSNLQSIEDDAFSDCQTLSSVKIPGSVVTMGDGVFFACPKLTTVEFEAGADQLRIGDRLFVDAPVRTFILGRDIEYSGTDSEYVFGENTTLYEVTILSSVSCIADCMFAGCSRLSEITLPANMTKVGANAFQGCDAITTVTSKNEKAPTAYASTFSSTTYSTATLKVPDGAENEYKNATCWKNFSKFNTLPAVNKYKVTVTKEGYGSVSINGSTNSSVTVNQDDELVIIARPDDGYVVKSAEYTMGGSTVKFESSATIKAVTGDVNVKVVFAEVPPVVPVEISIYPSSITLKPGETAALEVSFEPWDSAGPLTWTIDNKNVASVDDDGVVTAKANGSAVVTATTVNGISAKCSVTVSDGTSYIMPIPALDFGQRWQARLVVNNEVYTGNVEWSCDDPSLLRISGSGVILVQTSDFIMTTIHAKTADGTTFNYDYVGAGHDFYLFYTANGMECVSVDGYDVSVSQGDYAPEGSLLEIPEQVVDENGMAYEVNSIGNFINLVGITELVIPATVKYITYISLPDVTKVTCNAVAPPVVESSISFSDYVVIYVPGASTGAYKAVDGWKIYRIESQSAGGNDQKYVYCIYYVHDTNYLYDPIYCYIWDAGQNNMEITAKWPGNVMTETDEIKAPGAYSIWKYEFETELPLVQPMVVFNNVYQTKDLQLINNGIYTYSGWTGNFAGVGSVAVADDTLVVDGRDIRYDGAIAVYTINGVLVANGSDVVSVKAAGTYVVVTPAGAVKVNVK